MRRFEFTDGSSQKFWEIDLQGTGFTVRWGRIGTDGQTQQKSFASTDKAQAEHDKLIAEKRKKGYAEEAGGAPAVVTTPAPLPEPEPTAPPATEPVPAPAPDPSGPVFWTDSLLGRVHPRRGGVRVPVRPPTPVKKLWAQVREELRRRLPNPLFEDTHADNLTARTRDLAARIENPEPTLGTPEDDALLLAFVQRQLDWQDKPRPDLAAELLFSLGGPAHTTRAALLSRNIFMHEQMADGETSRIMARQPQALTDPNDHPYKYKRHGPLALPRLRALLATQTDDAGYQAARDAAASLMTLETQHSTAVYLFPTEVDWVHAEARAFVNKPDGRTLLLCSIADRDTLALILPQLNPWYVTRGEHDCLPSLLDGLGMECLPLLKVLISYPNINAEFKPTWAAATSALDSDEAMALLIEQASHKEVAAFLLDAALRWPQRALRLLGPKASIRGKDGDFARNILTHLLRRAPASFQAALAGQSPETLAVAAQLQSQSGPDVPDATPEQLPPVLATPPWRSRQKPEALPVLEGVMPPALDDALVWREGEREEWLRQKGSDADQFATYTPELWDTAFRDKHPGARNPPGTYRIEPAFFAYAPEALALKYLDQYPGRWNGEAWLPHVAARLGLAVLPILLHRTTEKTENARLLAPYAVAGLAPQMAETFQYTKKFRPLARGWLLRHPAHATAGLLVPALGKPGKAKDAACAALRLLASEGHEATVLDIASRSTPPARDAVARVLSFDPLLLFPAKPPKLPASLGVESLPPPLLADRSAKLPPDALEALATMLSFSTLEEPYAGLEQVKAACDRPSLARFAWALFEAWMLAGAPSKENWAFQALGLLGDDDTARKLAPLIRLWPGEAAHARAVTGLDILATIGTDVTLIYLNGIAEKVKFKGLQQKAQEKIEQIAEARGLTREELADRLVPDLGLDDSGSLSLDFGPRTFTVGFDEQLKPFVRDSDGTRLKDLPKPTQKDDTDKATAAAEQWKALKKDAKVAAGTQILRLELAMCARRRWSPEVFRQFFVEHPLLIHVVRRLVWGVYSPEGAVQSTFRVAEDRSLADSNDDTFTLPEGALVGLPHALELDAKTAGTWGQLFADYQLIQPFSQLGRPSYALQASERDATKLERVAGLKLPTGKVLGLETRGWRRGAPQDGGVVCWMEKPLGPDLMAYLDLEEGIYTGAIADSPEQVLGNLVVREPNTWGEQGIRSLNQLDPILFSELVRDLEALRPT